MAAVAQLPAAPPEDSPVEILNNERADTRPTWFNPGQFLELDFDADEYVTGTKRYVPLDVLKKLLDDHLAELKAKLVEVINEDYASFVGLSPKLAPVEGHMLRLRNPLLQLKVKVGDAKGMVSMELEALKDSLSRQQQLADARVTLELMQHTAQCLSKVETLLKELQAAALEDLLAHSRLLERVAGEAGRLHFYLNKGASLQFIQGMRPRIEASCSLLLKHLKQALGTALESDDAVAAGHLLHGFALMQQSEEALAVLRTAAVKPLVRAAFRDAKAAAADGAGGGSSAQLLSVALQAVLEGMKTQLAAVMQLCSTPQAGLGIGALLSGAVLPEVHSVLTQQLPGAFSPGVRASFLESYLSATSFLRSVEARCATTADVTALRSSAAHAALLKCWNLSVYFSLCFQDIAGALEAALPSSTPPQAATGDEAASSGREGGGAPELQHSRAVVSCVQACLQDDMFLLPLADRFLKLVLQALLRYAACTREAHAWRPREDSGAGAGAAADGADDAGSSAWWLRLSMDQVLQLAADAAKVERDCTQHARTRIAALLQPLEDAPLLQRCLQALDAAAAEVQASGNGLLQLVANELVAQGVMQLKQMKGIAATYRMTSRAAPTRPSPYVMHITRALQAVLQGAAGAQLSAAQQALLVERSAAGLCTQYRALALELLETWRRTESSLRRVKARPGLTASEGSTSPVPGPGAGMSDMDKILLQLSLDVQEFGRQLQELGLGASGMVEFRELLDSVSAPVAGT